jgi:hypothetical protein
MIRKYGPLNSGMTSCIDTTATEVGNKPVVGKVVGVYLKLDIACASNPTIAITTQNNPATTILNVTTDHDGWFYPRAPIHLPGTGAVIANLKTDGIPIHDFIRVAISDAADGDNVDVWLYLED